MSCISICFLHNQMWSAYSQDSNADGPGDGGPYKGRLDGGPLLLKLTESESKAGNSNSSSSSWACSHVDMMNRNREVDPFLPAVAKRFDLTPQLIGKQEQDSSASALATQGHVQVCQQR